LPFGPQVQNHRDTNVGLLHLFQMRRALVLFLIPIQIIAPCPTLHHQEVRHNQELNAHHHVMSEQLHQELNRQLEFSRDTESILVQVERLDQKKKQHHGNRTTAQHTVVLSKFCSTRMDSTGVRLSPPMCHVRSWQSEDRQQCDHTNLGTLPPAPRESESRAHIRSWQYSPSGTCG